MNSNNQRITQEQVDAFKRKLSITAKLCNASEDSVLSLLRMSMKSAFSIQDINDDQFNEIMQLLQRFQSVFCTVNAKVSVPLNEDGDYLLSVEGGVIKAFYSLKVPTNTVGVDYE